MSDRCPLCGNEKSKESLFCPSCTKKIRNEYEVDLPEQMQHIASSSAPDVLDSPDVSNSSSISDLQENSIEEVDHVDVSDEKGVDHVDIVDEEEVEFVEDPIEEPIEYVEETASQEIEYVAAPSETAEETVREDTEYQQGDYTHSPNYDTPKSNKGRNVGRTFLYILLAALLVVGAYYAFDEFIRKGNMERSGWDTATKENSAEGYLRYIEKFPDGAHSADAQAALMQLKSDEASRWEVLKQSDRITELRDFLRDHPQSNYTPLIKRRLDSLTWMGILHSNTDIAYAEYLSMAEKGDFNGDYRVEAESRHQMLAQTDPVDQPTLDSLRIVVNNFCTAASSLNHSELRALLVPHVDRYFANGPTRREKLLGELSIEAARSDKPVATLIPDLEGVQYQKSGSDIYLVNLPLLKSQTIDEKEEQYPGYILHLKLNGDYKIFSVHETKPHPDAP